MKNQRMMKYILVFLISYQLATTSFAFLSTGSGADIESGKSNANKKSNLDVQCEDRYEFIRSIEDSQEDSWIKPQSIRKLTMISKICTLFNLIENEQYEEAYDKLLHDIKPKLSGLKTDENEDSWGNGMFTNPWVTSSILQEELKNICNTILTDLRELIEDPDPYVDDDNNPPTIILTPNNLVIEDGDVPNGVLIYWQIIDSSGIAEAIVTLNGVEISYYGLSEQGITDSYLLPCVPGVYTIDVFAKDNDNDPEHPDGVDWLENSAQTTITIVDDDVTPPSVDITYVGEFYESNPGVWNVLVEDLESGLAEVVIKIDGSIYLSQQGLEGISSIHYDEIPVPDIVGIHVIEIIAKNNDNDWISDQEVIEITQTTVILPDPGDPGPGPIIIGLSYRITRFYLI